MYKHHIILNPNNHPSSSSVVCYHGKSPWKKHKKKLTYLRISDCQMTVQLHRTDYDSKQDFVNKLKLLEETIRDFRLHLEK